jgi:hypothetical protein
LYHQKKYVALTIVVTVVIDKRRRRRRHHNNIIFRLGTGSSGRNYFDDIRAGY